MAIRHYHILDAVGVVLRHAELRAQRQEFLRAPECYQLIHCVVLVLIKRALVALETEACQQCGKSGAGPAMEHHFLFEPLGRFGTTCDPGIGVLALQLHLLIARQADCRGPSSLFDSLQSGHGRPVGQRQTAGEHLPEFRGHRGLGLGLGLGLSLGSGSGSGLGLGLGGFDLFPVECKCLVHFRCVAKGVHKGVRIWLTIEHLAQDLASLRLPEEV